MLECYFHFLMQPIQFKSNQIKSTNQVRQKTENEATFKRKATQHQTTQKTTTRWKDQTINTSVLIANNVSRWVINSTCTTLNTSTKTNPMPKPNATTVTPSKNDKSESKHLHKNKCVRLIAKHANPSFTQFHLHPFFFRRPTSDVTHSNGGLLLHFKSIKQSMLFFLFFFLSLFFFSLRSTHSSFQHHII